MAINDPIGDLLTRIRNGQLRELAKVATPASKAASTGRMRLVDRAWRLAPDNWVSLVPERR